VNLVRLVDCPADEIRNTTPLKENGPDPVIDKDILTEEWLETLMKKKHVPIKALMLHQGNISGIGNWVGDEILYHAKLHPEQYSDTFSSAQIKQLHESIIHICQTAVDLLGDSSKFPEEWLFKHRWGKGKKDAPTTLPNGDKITHITVGGRTSCIVPSVQIVGGPKQETDEINEKVASGDVSKKPHSKKRKCSSESQELDDAKIPESELEQVEPYNRGRRVRKGNAEKLNKKVSETPVRPATSLSVRNKRHTVGR